MTRRRCHWLCALLGLSLGGTRAYGEPEPGSAVDEPAGETIVVVDHAPDPDGAARDRDRALGDAPFVTVVHPDEHPAAMSVADAVASAAGAHTRSLGGLGAFASVSIRGAAPGHTAVLIDGIPLARIAEVTTDLGRFTLDSFGEVELYRGAVPVELGGAGVGGALNLVTRLGPGEHGELFSGSLGGGSFGDRHVRARYGDRYGDVEQSTTIGYTGATGNYSYYDDHGTPLNRTDDSYQTRHNNWFDAVDGATRWATVDRALAGGLRVAFRDQGLPGSLFDPALDARLATTDVIGDGAFDLGVAGGTARQLAYLVVERQHLDDPKGELGFGAEDREDLTLAGAVSSTFKRAFDRHRLELGVELRGERFTDRAASGGTAEIGDRLAGAVTAAFDVAVDALARLVITPAVRLDVMRTAAPPVGDGIDPTMPPPPRYDTIPSPRITSRLAATSDLTVKGSAGYYARLPTLYEVFGNHGYLLGSPGLKPETGPTADLGLVWAPAVGGAGFDRIFVEADGFGHQAHNTIALITSGGFVSRADNIGDTQAWGGELTASARFAGLATATASYTRTVSEQYNGDQSTNGKQVPRTPGHLLVAHLELAHPILHRMVSLWGEADYQSTSYLDNANMGEVPARALISAGVRLELVHGLALALSVANLADIRVVELPLDPPPSPTFTQTPTALTDVAGYPLPGRSFDLTLDWTY